MSRDSRLIHTHLLHLREHLAEHNAEIEARVAAAHAELDAKHAAPARDTHQPVAFELPQPPPSSKDDETADRPGA